MRVVDLPSGGLRVLAPAKVNLYLEVLGRREDGYHEIDTLMQAVSLFDELEARPRPEGSGLRLQIVGPGGEPHPLTAGEDNLVLKAARLLARTAGGGPRSADLRLVKRIPLGAGLGGGSSDAAAALWILSRLWGLSLSREDLLPLAAELGSDVPFFLHGGLARCRGRGERITPLGDGAPREPLHLVLVYPRINVSTSLIYKELDLLSGSMPGLTKKTALDTMSLQSVWKALRGGELYFNRLEAVATRAFPELKRIQKEIQREPVLATLMSGSGSTIFGVCRNRKEAGEIGSSLRERMRGEVYQVESEAEP